MWNTKRSEEKMHCRNTKLSYVHYRKIVENKVDQALVVEDDVNIDFQSLRKIDLKKLYKTV